ncbi:MAG TPA: hypothetical protein VFA54_10930 [Bryobacterales bacterium]|jgi:protein ImuB|nr:hypothetical protein [Bryobacterales bacterium]
MFACLHAPELPDSFHALLIHCACGFSPRVEDTGAQTAVLDIEGLDRLLGSPRQIAEAMARRAGELGIPANVAVASNPDAAVHAARGFRGITVIPKGLEASVLASLPVEVLSPPPEILETLESWGIRRFGELAALPETGVAARLGAEGVRLHKLARGVGERALAPAIPAETLEAGIELEHPVALLEPLSFLLARLLDELLEKVEARGLAVDELRLRLKLEPRGEDLEAGRAPAESALPETAGGDPLQEKSRRAGYGESSGILRQSKISIEHARTIRLPFPMRSAKTFLKLLASDLETHPPQAPVIAVSLAAVPADPRLVQYGFFLPPAPEPEKLELTLGRIRKLVGAENVGAAELLDTHRPQAFRVRPFAVPQRSHTLGWRASGYFPKKDAGEASPGKAQSASRAEPGSFAEASFSEAGRSPHRSLALRVFRPPLRAHVEAPSGRPARIVARGLHAPVISQAGPWRSSGDWWTAGGWSRDEWDVALSDGAIYRIYLDRLSGAWFVEGYYD